MALQATLSLGEFHAEQVVPAFASVIEKHGQNNWFRIAVLSSEAGSSLPLLELLLKRDLFFTEAKSEWAAFLGDFSYVIGARNREGEIAGLLKVLTTADLKKERGLRLEGLTGLARGMKKSEHKIKADIKLKEALKNLDADSSNEVKVAMSEISKLVE